MKYIVYDGSSWCSFDTKEEVAEHLMETLPDREDDDVLAWAKDNDVECYEIGPKVRIAITPPTALKVKVG